MSSRTTEFRLLTLAGCTAALVPRLAHRGMFLDGVTYASISRNLAEGRGRFWEPFYTATIYPAFHEHPPLVFWLQSLWFRALGDHWYVERLYCLAAAVIIAALIAITWRAAYRADTSVGPCKNGETDHAGADLATNRAGADPRVHHQRDRSRDDEWLPIAMWMLAPVVSWSIVGNLLEPTVCAFVTAAIAAITIGSGKGPFAAFAAGAVSGLCVVGAVLSKGPVGLFPLAAPVIMTLLPDRWRSSMYCAAGQWIAVALCAASLWTSSSAHQSLSAYVNQQLITALAGEREVSGSSFTILIELLQGVGLPMAAAMTLVAIVARRWAPPTPRDRRVAIAFILIGMSGTLPMLVSPKQTGHYVMPAVPFYAIGAAAIVAETTRALVANLSRRGVAALRTLVAAIAVVGVAAIWVPAIERDRARLADLDRVAAYAPRGAIVGICPAANGDWLLHAWMQRRFGISLDAAAPRAHDWFLKSTEAGSDCPPATCVSMSEPGGTLGLMRCR